MNYRTNGLLQGQKRKLQIMMGAFKSVWRMEENISATVSWQKEQLSPAFSDTKQGGGYNAISVVSRKKYK